MADNMDLQINITGNNQTGGEFSQLDSALSDLQKLAMDVSKSFETFAQSIGAAFNGGAQEAQAIDGALSGVSQEADVATQSIDDMMRAFFNTSVETELQAIVKSMEEVDTAAATMGETVNRSMQQASDGANGMDDSMKNLSEGLGAEMIGEQLKQIGETGMKAFEEASGAAADFEFNISRISAVLTTSGKASNAQIQQMSEDALKLGSSSSFSANQISEGMYTLARQGLTASQILGDGVNGAINVVNDLAQATDSSMTDTATVITDVVHEYNLSGSQLRDVANTMSGALHNSSISLDDFYQSMKQVGPVASAMHQNALDMSTALALLAQHGITGSSAGTALKNMLLGLSPRTKAAAADFAKLGISVQNGASNSFFDLQGNLKPLPDIIDLLNQKFNGLSDAQKQAALSTVFTKYGLAGLNTIVTESRSKFMAFQEELKKDDAATIAAKKMDNLHGDLLKFNAGIQTMAKSFGDSINGMIRPIVQMASQAVAWITQLPKPVKEAGMAILGLGSALAIIGGNIIAFAGGIKLLGPAIEMAGMSTAGFEAIAATLGGIFTGILVPIATVVAIIAVLAGAFYLAYQKITPFRNLVNQLWADLKTFADNLLKALLPVVQKVWNGIVTAITNAFNVVMPVINSALQTILAWWNSVWPEIAQILDTQWTVIKSVIETALSLIEFNLSGALGFIKGAWNDAWQAMVALLKVSWDLMKGAVQLAWTVISGIIKTGLDIATGNWRAAWNDFLNIFKGIWTTIKSNFGNLISDAFDFGKHFVMAIANGISGAISSVISAAKNVVSTIVGIFSSAPSAPSVGSSGGGSEKYNAPHFASGGFVDSATYALVGEAGPEAIIPLSDPKKGLALWQQAGMMLGVGGMGSRGSSGFMPSDNNGSGGININVYASGNITRNEQQLGNIVSNALLNKMKMQGKF